MNKPLFLILAFWLCASYATAQSFRTDTGYVEFKSSVPLHSFTGKSKHLVGKISLPDSTVDFYVDLNTLNTGIGKRDKDMKKTLEVEDYPFAEFYGTFSESFTSSLKDTQQVKVKGEFKIHGISQEVEITGSIYPSDEGLWLQAAWMLRLEDYDIKAPGFLFYRVNQEQEIMIEALLTPTE